LDELAGRQLNALPSTASDKQGNKHDQGKRRSGLREDQRLDGMQRFSGEREFAGEDGTAERGGDSPEESGRGDEEKPSQRVSSIGC